MTWTRIHDYLMHTGVTRQQASQLYTLLRMSDLKDIEKQVQRFDVFLTRMGMGENKTAAAGRAIEAVE